MNGNIKADLLVLTTALGLLLPAQAASPEAGIQLTPAPLLARPVAEPPDAVATSPAPLGGPATPPASNPGAVQQGTQHGKPLCSKTSAHYRLQLQGGHWLPTCAPSKAPAGVPGGASASQTAKPPHQ